MVDVNVAMTHRGLQPAQPTARTVGDGGDGIAAELVRIRELLETNGAGATINVDGSRAPAETASAIQQRYRARRFGA
jgi:hypothetical protein